MTKLFACLLCTLAVLATFHLSPTGVASNDRDRLVRFEPTFTTRPVEHDQSQEKQVRSAQTADTFTSLIEKARSQGSVRVIVGLEVMDYKPEGQLGSAKAVGLQRLRIAQAQDEALTRIANFDFQLIAKFQFVPFVALEVSGPALEGLKDSKSVVSIQEDIPVAPGLAESIPLVGAPNAWASGFTGAGQTIAILDTGVDKAHPFLAGKVVSEACFSSNTFESSSLCPGGASSSTSSGSGQSCASFITGCDHGTHVAGIAAGKGSTASGVARDANIIAIQVFSRFNSSTVCKDEPIPCARTYPSDYVRGLERVYALRSSFNIASANMSLGGGRYFLNCDSEQAGTKAAIDNLRSVGIATAISSGNNGYKDSLGSPACISTAISVGSTGDGSFGATRDVVVSSSNSASFLRLLAPGRWINSSVPGGSFENFNGTSMAAPHVAGAWAVLKSKKPTASVDEVFAALRDTGLSITDVNGISKPRIQVDAAVAALGDGGGCITTPIVSGQTRNGVLASTDCRYPAGSQWYSDPYSFNGVAGQQVAISMSSSEVDSWIALQDPNGAQIAFDDNGGGGINARIPANTGYFTLPATGTYLIQASTTLTNQTGNYSVSLTTLSSGPSNDFFVNSEVLTGSGSTVFKNSVGATKEANEPSHASNFGGASIWYRWQAPSSGTVTLTTAGSNFDTLLAVYTGSSVGALSAIMSNDDESFPAVLTSKVIFNAVAGTTYRIAVDGFNGASGSVVLKWTLGTTGPANNNFVNAQTITGSSGSVSANNAGATVEAGEPFHGGAAGGVSVWYQWQAPATGNVVFSTSGSNFDTLLGVYTGSAVNGLTLVAGNDDEAFPSILTSKVFFAAVAGTTYRLAVDGYGGAIGNFTLGWVLTATQTRTLTIGSSNPNSGVNVIVSPVDNSSLGNGMTQFTRTYNNNVVVSLTAPATATGNTFQKWQRNGADWSTNPTTNLTMDANHSMTAIYVNNAPTLQLNAANYLVPESSAAYAFTVTRTGDTSGAATVHYSTNDVIASSCQTVTGNASAKCDYATSGGTLRFAAGEVSKLIIVSVVDDTYPEGSETLSISLSNASGASLGSPSTATITVQDNDSDPNAPNAYLGNPFFVRQQYLDFLLREPDAAGFNDWLNVLNGCGPGQGWLGSPPGCDRVHVTSGFFRSTEFGEKGYWIYRFYEVGLGRRPQFGEFIVELRRLSGLMSTEEQEVRRADFISRFMQLPQFTSQFAGLTDSPSDAAAFVTKLEQVGRVTLPATATTEPGQPPQYGRADLINRMATGQFTAAQTMRAFIEQKVVWDTYFYRAFVAMQYFGYLRRDPEDAGYNDWVDVLTNGRASAGVAPGDYRHLIFGFVYSVEYRERFGKP